ncbi:uncharacterized protein LOC110420174 isoform X1 [Herrania umbratica]|uniref:Uncharacterized protein LOC110420174 isoform X1 n=1 Tax=Herrania umbratica TaxID=108875 RepID=A0A6J1AQ13_9ROSI|nr:uncharacterized protein LOC110420174 isoform X1 [Herrania umbratica]
MSIEFHHRCFVSLSRSSNPWISRNSFGAHVCCKRIANLDYLLTNWGNLRKNCLIRQTLSDSHRLVAYRKTFSALCKSRRKGLHSPLASAEDGVTVNGSPQTSTSTDVDEIMVKLNQSLQGEDYSNGLVQSLHDAARVFELAIKEQGSLSKMSWFSTAWLGVDRNAWVKTLSYQAAVYSLLQAASEISCRGDSRDRDINVFVQRSLLRQSAPLESLIREKLSAKQPEAYDWFWIEQVPAVVISFVHYFEGDLRYTAATDACGKGKPLGAGSSSDKTLLMLALTCVAAITKLGPAKISCSHFFSMIPDLSGRLMDMLVDFIPIHQAYHSIKDIGLCREFLVHFGPRAAACRVENDQDSEEVIFWVDLVQKQLQQAIDREKIWSRLTTSESIEVLERDLTIFGFFIALGRNTQAFLSANGFDVIDDPVGGFIRYLIGGSVLYYPQLSSISSYQLYVEVVCEELDWLPFYPSNVGTAKQSHGLKSQREGPPNIKAISQALDVCSHWTQSFIKYSRWLENPSNVKAARFLSRGHNKLMECMKELGIPEREMVETSSVGRTGLATDKESDSFDKALESVEEALKRLENLLQQLHVSSSYSGKEQLKAACSDLDKIRKLKKEAEFLEASFRAKEAFFRQDDGDGSSQSSVGEQQQYPKTKPRKSATVTNDRSNRVVNNSRGLWSLLTRPPIRNPDTQSSAVEKLGNEFIEENTSNICIADSEQNEIRRFEQLRNELIELEKRVKRSADQSAYEDIKVREGNHITTDDAGCAQLVEVQKKESVIEKSLNKIKETTTDVFQGTQLLAIDVAAAMELLRRVLIGDELAEKEKKALQRTLTDLASVVPIGVLMLLPVTAVGHAAILAAIQRYVPALIPSTYGSERLDLLRQLEKVKEMETSEVDCEENLEEDA